jgi:hypothetical protein
LAAINHVFARLPNIDVLSRRHHQLAIAAWWVPQNTCVITSFFRVTLRDVVTMFTFAIVSSNAWARQCKTSGMTTAPAGKPPQTRQAEILDQSRCIGNNWEGELAIGNYRDPEKIGSYRECRISVSGIAIIL